MEKLLLSLFGSIILLAACQKADFNTEVDDGIDNDIPRIEIITPQQTILFTELPADRQEVAKKELGYTPKTAIIYAKIVNEEGDTLYRFDEEVRLKQLLEMGLEKEIMRDPDANKAQPRNNYFTFDYTMNPQKNPFYPWISVAWTTRTKIWNHTQFNMWTHILDPDMKCGPYECDYLMAYDGYFQSGHAFHNIVINRAATYGPQNRNTWFTLQAIHPIYNLVQEQLYQNQKW